MINAKRAIRHALFIEFCANRKVIFRIDQNIQYWTRHDNKLSCADCDVKFETKKLYSIHMNKVHKTTKMIKKFSCEICGKLFTGK